MAESSSPLFTFPGDDPEMTQAFHKARQTFRYFWREMAWEQRRIVPGLELAVVKGAFSDPPEVKAKNPGGLEAEHMWMADVEFDGKQIQGTLLNSPHSLKSFQEGDKVTIKGSQLSDWMYVILGKTYGGFTIDLMRSRMGKAERQQHDDAWGFDFGEVGQVKLVPADFLTGGASAKKWSLASLFGGAKNQPQDYEKVAATEHPMSVNMRSSLEKALKENAKMIHEADDRGYTYLHQLALAGSWDGVDICLKHGADPKKPAPNGMTPFALAKCLGWTRVMERLQQAGGG